MEQSRIEPWYCWEPADEIGTYSFRTTEDEKLAKRFVVGDGEITTPLRGKRLAHAPPGEPGDAPFIDGCPCCSPELRLVLLDLEPAVEFAPIELLERRYYLFRVPVAEVVDNNATEWLVEGEPELGWNWPVLSERQVRGRSLVSDRGDVERLPAELCPYIFVSNESRLRLQAATAQGPDFSMVSCASES